MENEKLNLNILDNLNYSLLNLKNAINEANNLEDKVYFELSKGQIIEYLNYVYTSIKGWENDYKVNNYEVIIKQYKNVESIISELELCLADLDDEFNIEGISFALFNIGKMLFN